LVLKCKKKEKTILFLENFPIENAGYQYRAEKWAEILRNEGYDVTIWTIYESKLDFEQNIQESKFSKFLIFAMKKRFKQVIASRNFKTVIVRRELLLYNDYCDLFLDKFLLKLHPNAILDFDDDISAAKNQPKKITNWFGKLMRENGNKFNDSIRLYKNFIVASNYLKNRVLDENKNLNVEDICIIPTCVDYNNFPVKVYKEDSEMITFGWIGGDHNYPQLDLIIPILMRLAEKRTFKLIVIGGREYNPISNFEIEFRPWSLDNEVMNLYDIDVGLMPLEDNPRTRGKGGFKLIQYMGLGIVSVASAITINNEIIENEKNSFLVDSIESNNWENTLEDILQKKVNLEIIGKNARRTIVEKYSFIGNRTKYLNFIVNV
jgi:glycosyltransferase involved in cell wall biosynthesis